jgi:hypothetical protein
MPLVGLEAPIPMFERAKMVHALDRAATEIGQVSTSVLTNLSKPNISPKFVQRGSLQ